MNLFNISHIYTQALRAKVVFASRLFMFLISTIAIGAMVVDYGFVLDEAELAVVHGIYDCAWWAYFVIFFTRLLFTWRAITRKKIFMTALLAMLLLLTALPVFFTPTGRLLSFAWLWDIFSNKFVTVAVVALFAFLEVSQGVVNFINKKTNPALLMATAFAVIIAFGTLLLLLPRSTHDDVRLAVADALFVATSSVCVTGLTPVDIAGTFSMEGQVVIMLLIQTGGLGVMTITSFFALFFMGGTSFYNQFALRDMVGSDTFSSLISTLLYILGFTFMIELAGAFFIWLTIHSCMGMTLFEELFFSFFHSVSAFCNAGFSTLSGNLGNELVMGHNAFFLVISFLVVLGGISFPILINFKNVLFYHLSSFFMKWFRKGAKRPRYVHLANINTKIVLVVTAVLLLGGTMVIAVLEWNGAFASMSVSEKLVHSFFNAVVPRTAGFNSVDLTHFSLLTIIFYTFLMWIGGASQSTAGGIKVNTFAVAVANFMTVVRGRENVVLFNRELRPESVRRALAVIFGSLFTIFTFFVLLLITEPHLSPLGILFEVVSAFSTVGSSLNITSSLGNDSKVLLSLLMFVGRVGVITVVMGVVHQASRQKLRCPGDNVIIN